MAGVRCERHPGEPVWPVGGCVRCEVAATFEAAAAIFEHDAGDAQRARHAPSSGEADDA
jgi:hypothetical protein